MHYICLNCCHCVYMQVSTDGSRDFRLVVQRFEDHTPGGPRFQVGRRWWEQQQEQKQE